MVQRWQQLPLDHALQRVPQMRALLHDLAGRDVPYLGPAVVMDQLTVLVYDTCEAGMDHGLPDRLRELLRALS
ncbi:hypothetical protein [Pedococcus sp. 5OH_020]|uniref:hypothetical protein n=1 Tax=Pedococcus sp. 5OH_020 TaxID=2989814 RepID=UPI0022E9F558|nr:hypothetical protein [Pedococcus sp. 5OH_020]